MILIFGNNMSKFYPLVISHSYWKWPFIVSFLIENGDFLSEMLVYQRVSKLK